MTRPSDHAGPILVTGAAGFIGSHLCEALLAAGRSVVGLDNLCDFYDPAVKRRNLLPLMGRSGSPSFTLAQIDIRDRTAVMAVFASHRPASVIHLAAMAGVRPSIENPALYTAVNLDGTVHLLDAALSVWTGDSRPAAGQKSNPNEGGVGTFVFASSSSVYGNNRKVPFSEDDPVDRPISPYAATKRAGELLCHTYHHLHGIDISCLRFFTVYGPRQRPDLAIGKFMASIAAGKRITMFGDGSSSRDYTYIDDIVAGIRAAHDRCRGYHIYNLGNSEPVSLREMIATIERVVGRPALIDTLPMQPGDVERTYADLTRSRADLDYQPRVPFEEGVGRQWEWMRSLGR